MRYTKFSLFLFCFIYQTSLAQTPDEQVLITKIDGIDSLFMYDDSFTEVTANRNEIISDLRDVMNDNSLPLVVELIDSGEGLVKLSSQGLQSGNHENLLARIEAGLWLELIAVELNQGRKIEIDCSLVVGLEERPQAGVTVGFGDGAFECKNDEEEEPE